VVIKYNSPAQNLTKKDVAGFIEKARQEYHIPALAVVVMDSDRICITEIQGKKLVNSSDDAELDEYFHIGSCSKSILAVVAGKQVDAGKLNWHTRFFDFYPELSKAARKDYLDITLEDLLLCQAGIQPFLSGTDFSQLDASVFNSRPAFIQYLIKQDPATDKTRDGFKHLYSNASYTLAAAMLERVANSIWEELIRNTLSHDLGLSVVFGWPNNTDQNQPWGHINIDGSVQALPPDHDYKLPDIIAPAGDLSMTPLDYAKYVQLHLQGLRGADNYLTAETYRAIHYRQRGYSFGVENETSWGERYSTIDGSAGTFFCSSMIFPESDFAFVIMTNSGTERAIEGVSWISKKIIKKHYNLWWMFWM
jgi:CubicO group peptidase (beta-lactamase class C family)